MGKNRGNNLKPILLYVSDDKFMHLIIKDTLANKNIIIYDVYSVNQALEKMKSVTPDLILSDIDLPGLSGFDLCKILKSSPATSNIPVVIYSSSENENTILEAYEAGAKGYVIKKYHHEELANKIMRFIV